MFGFMSISICFTAMAAWAWFLSHDSLGGLGLAYLGFVFFTIIFQISWSGHLKEMEISERGNLLIRMGARLTPKDTTNAVYLPKKFIPGRAQDYGLVVKMVNLMFGWLLIYALSFDWALSLWLIVMTGVIGVYLHRLLVERVYVRSRELFNISIMEVATIFFPIPLLVGWAEGIVLMAFGVMYFFGMNLWLWKASHPRV